MDKIKPHHVNEFYNNLEEKGVREDTRYKCVLDVRELLKQGNINKKELAEKSDVAINTVYSFSKNQNINFASAAKIALALNYDIESMFKPIGKEFLSKTTIHHYHSLLNTMFNSAVKWGIININPCSRVESPRLGNMKKVYLDDKQAIRLINLLENEKPQYKMMINLFLETGFRRGELCGLKWEDIDFKNDIIYVRRQLIYVAQKGVLETTGKTESALRTIKVSKRIMGLLKEYKHWQLEERIKVGDRWEDRDMLFTTWCGKPMHPDTITKWFGEFVKKHDFPPVTIHSLRHTNASILIARGTPITTVSKRLGHSNAAVTGKIYAHEFQTADEIAASVIESVFNNSHIC